MLDSGSDTGMEEVESMLKKVVGEETSEESDAEEQQVIDQLEHEWWSVEKLKRERQVMYNHQA